MIVVELLSTNHNIVGALGLMRRRRSPTRPVCSDLDLIPDVAGEGPRLVSQLFV
jgi:hypothetical protein